MLSALRAENGGQGFAKLPAYVNLDGLDVDRPLFVSLGDSALAAGAQTTSGQQDNAVLAADYAAQLNNQTSTAACLKWCALTLPSMPSKRLTHA